MKTLIVGLCALGCLAVEAATASAAWNNVFQTNLVCFLRRRATSNCCPPPAVAYSAPCCTSCAPPAPAPCPAPCPQTSCSTSYVQRCYYQPVTVYQTQSYYEAVTTYRTSYYYEPVTTYTYRCYYDPCTCTSQQVATPCTSYRLKAQQCPVQSWVQRCCQVPVTAYQKACYWQPQTTCCTTTEGAPIPMAANGPPVVAQSPPVVIQQQQQQPPPNVYDNRAPSQQPPPIINDQKTPGTNGGYDRYYPPIQKQMNFQAPQGIPPAVKPIAPPPPPVKLDRIVVGPDAGVEGQVVRSDKTPRANARVQFVSADHLAPSQTVTANSAGRFQVTLASGGWLVYLDAPDGTQIFHSRIEVTANQPRITLVNR